MRGAKHVPRTNDHEVAQVDRVVALEVLEANFGAKNCHNVVLEEATPEDREQEKNHRSQRKRQRQIAEKEHRGEELGRRRAEDLREFHSAEQSDRRE